MNITNKDTIYIYRITDFNNFAPCFDDDIFSLACCKGNIKTGGMRRSICKRAENETDSNIWILAIAGKGLVGYNNNDMVYLAKVDRNMLYSWKEYSQKFPNRTDAIYDYQNGEMIRNNKNTQYHPVSCEHTELPTDCGIKMPDYCNVKQIIMSKEFYVFQSDAPFENEFQIIRGYRYIEADIDIKANLSKANITYNCKNPFA